MNKVEINGSPVQGPVEVGQYYAHDDGEVYLLSNIGKGAVLICLTDGGFWRLPVPVKRILEITESERSAIFGTDDFTRITSPITITPEA